MDEQRVQAYVSLIEQLLACPEGQEQALLQAQADLVDAGLLTVMEQVAAYLESQGQGNAGWLRQVAAQLAQALGMTTESASSASDGSGDAARFLLETLQLVLDHQGNPQQIYPIWAQQQAQFNAEVLAVVPTVIPQLLAQNAAQQPLIAAVLGEFGNLMQQFPLGTRELNLELAIAAYQESLSVRTQAAMPVEWAQTMIHIAIAYSVRTRGNRSENIEQALAIYQHVLSLMTPQDMPVEWATTMMNLANTYKNRIQGDRAENIEQAITAYQHTLIVRTQRVMPIEWAQTMHNLANAYAVRIRGDRTKNIEQAITAYQQALKVRTQQTMPVEWARTMNNLAAAYRNRVWGNHGENIEQSITFYKQVIKVMRQQTMPVEWATTMMNLATAYADRVQDDHGENIEASIAIYHQVLTVMTQQAMPVEWAQTMHNLATAYKKRIRGDHAENIEAAISGYEKAMTVRTQQAMPIEWAQTMNNWALAYNERIWGDHAENIEAAISGYEKAMTVRTQQAMPIEWAQTMNNWALAYNGRIRGDRSENIEQAISAYEQVMMVVMQQAMPVEQATTMLNLANAFSDRSRGDKAENIKQAIAYYQQSLSIFTPETLPDDCRKAARSLANLYSDHQRWPDAVTTYQTALHAAERLYQSANLLDSKAAALSATADLPRRAAYALARTGQLALAVETLEQGRARGLSESLDRDRADLSQLGQTHPDLVSQYQTLTQQLRTLEAEQRTRLTSTERHSLTPEAMRDAAIDLRQQLDQVIQAIRQVPGYESFLALPSFADVQRAVPPDRPLVYLVTTPTGSLALVVTPDAVQELWLDDLNESQLIDLLNQTWFAAYEQFPSNPQGWYDAIDAVTRQLWEPLMQPLIHHLTTVTFPALSPTPPLPHSPQATLIPTGLLSFLPLHAAWVEDSSTPTGRHYALDAIQFTYAPNARSLTAAQAIADHTAATTLLAIDNPRHDLPNSEREITAASHSFAQSTLLKHDQATVAAVQAQLPTADVVHFSCHGTANLNDPLTSGLWMSDGLLTLRDILALNLAEQGGIRLAVLSACETGLAGIENADEAISLPTGLLQAGVAAVIASLWSVSDLSTMLLLTKFYDLWRERGLPADQALRQAQIWLRDTTNDEKVAAFRAAMSAPVAGVRMSPDTAQQLFAQLAWEPGQERFFAHPFHWAAFSYTGV